MKCGVQIDYNECYSRNAKLETKRRGLVKWSTF